MFPEAVYALFIGKEGKGTKISERSILGHVESFFHYTPFISRAIYLQCHRKIVWFTRKSPGVEIDIVYIALVLTSQVTLST